ncbi:hypothetical protein RND81_10G004200 [Saponaria officinalis]|uniref:Secreted protein n=1 Tax=Saponaria officinalis TaxID=3572 RepID=A0AAW1HXS9_SAPOF
MALHKAARVLFLLCQTSFTISLSLSLSFHQFRMLDYGRRRRRRRRRRRQSDSPTSIQIHTSCAIRMVRANHDHCVSTTVRVISLSSSFTVQHRTRPPLFICSNSTL